MLLILEKNCKRQLVNQIKSYQMKQIDDSFYNSKEWKHKRNMILRRDKYQCQECRRYGRTTEAVTVHHIKHLDEHPELALEPSNLISLCNRCHNKAHPEKGGQKASPPRF